MAEKTFSIDLEEGLHERARKLALERKVPVKSLYADAIQFVLDGKIAYPYETDNRPLHDKLERVLNSGDEEILEAVVPNIEVFFKRLKPRRLVRKRGKSATGVA